MTTVTSTLGSQSSLMAAAQGTNKNSGDFNMFLKLLTSQMQNQDPLDPMKSSEYTQQLVQYSQVEQSIQQTSALKEILSRLSAQDMAQASAYIGREASFNSAVTGLDASGGSASWSYKPERPVVSMTATVTDASGKTVKQMELGSSTTGGRLDWDGMAATGVRSPEGPYSLTITAVDAAGNDVPVSVNAIGTVRNVANDGTQVVLGMGGVSLPVSSLLAVSAVP